MHMSRPAHCERALSHTHNSAFKDAASPREVQGRQPRQQQLQSLNSLHLTQQATGWLRAAGMVVRVPLDTIDGTGYLLLLLLCVPHLIYQSSQPLLLAR